MIFEWDINIRRSTIMGLVGAGGLGLVLFRQMAMSNNGGIAVVILADAGAHRLRRSGFLLCPQSCHLRPAWAPGAPVTTGNVAPKAGSVPLTWSRFKYPQSLYKYGALLGTLAFIAWSRSTT